MARRVDLDHQGRPRHIDAVVDGARVYDTARVIVSARLPDAAAAHARATRSVNDYVAWSERDNPGIDLRFR